MKNYAGIVLFSIMLPSALPAAPTEDLMPGVGRLIAAFTVVLALIFISVRLFKRLALKGHNGGNGHIRVIDSFPLHQRARLSIVEVAGRVFLISVTDHEVSMIAEYDPMEFAGSSSENGQKNFLSYLHLFRRKQEITDKVSAG